MDISSSTAFTQFLMIAQLSVFFFFLNLSLPLLQRYRIEGIFQYLDFFRDGDLSSNELYIIAIGTS